MIRFGPAGIPLSCKGRTLLDGVEEVHALGLTAMEVQLIRTATSERLPDEEEIGKSPLELETDLIVSIKRDEEIIEDPEEKIRREDELIVLESNLCHSYKELEEVAQFGQDHDIQLSVHASYYVDFTGREELVSRSKQNLKLAGLICNALSGSITVTQLGFYGSRGRKEGTAKILKSLREIRDWWKDNRFSFPIGIETSGRSETFGSLEEVVNVAKRVSGTCPALNFAHLHAREKDAMNNVEDVKSALEKARKAADGFLYTIFSGVERTRTNEIRLTPIKRGDLKFEPVAELMVEENYDMTVISSSPLLEHDAVYMGLIFERTLLRSLGKEEKAKER
ncbi:MAG: TIM barrel protein [Methanomassiliicoccales archaeon]